MSRPEHLNCVNTAEGIRRINEEQRRYDADPAGYEAEQEELARAEWDREMQAREDEDRERSIQEEREAEYYANQQGDEGSEWQ